MTGDRSEPVALGREYRNRVDGFEGTAVARTEFLNGCVQVCLQGPSKDGKPGEEAWIDEQQLVGNASARSGGGFRSHP
jgi:hypothetical protein